MAAEFYTAIVHSAQDYYPFGWEMPGTGRSLTAFDGYRYGFNGKEKDQNGEFGSITNYDYGFRIYNPGIARFLRVDPLAEKMSSWSPYNYGFNNPIMFTDPDGMAPDNEYQMVHNANGTRTTTQISTKGGDQQDIIHHSNGVSIPQNGASGYTEVLDNNSGGSRLAPGVFADRPASGSLQSVDDPITAVEKGGLKPSVFVIGAVIKKEGMEVAENAAENIVSNSIKIEGRTAAGHATDKFGNKLGPSGKPQVNVVQYSSQKRAKDAARNEGNGAPVKHTNPTQGNRHYHATDKSGNKKPTIYSTHHEY
ncbi:MAG: RHS repeat-associated core domain-containing protein [Saprospiraceae bacterium]|nr:RHS repeat-associated core domain-containing protein [Saprospiraceae bacterium]